MNRRIGYSAGLVSLVGLAACGRQPATVSDDMQRDLALASTSAVELAPRARQTSVVSALELGKTAAPEKAEAPQAAPARQTVRAPRAQPTHATPTEQQVASAPEPQPVAPAPTPVAEAPAPAPSPTVERAPAPPPMPMPSQTPRRGRGRSNGGWWSTGDVIRNAPFPINP